MLRGGSSGEVAASALGAAPALARESSLARSSMTSTTSLVTALPDDGKEAKVRVCVLPVFFFLLAFLMPW
jgi:hypothetical protein